MAVNYTLAQAVEILVNNEDTEAVVDICKRYPLLAMRVFMVAAHAPEPLIELVKYIPDYVTANKVNSAIKKATMSDDVESDDDAETEKPKATTGKKRGRKPKVKAEAEDTEETPYDGSTAMELFKECKKRGLRAAPKKGQKYYIDILTKDDAMKAAEAEEEAEDDDYEDDDDWDI